MMSKTINVADYKNNNTPYENIFRLSSERHKTSAYSEKDSTMTAQTKMFLMLNGVHIYDVDETRLSSRTITILAPKLVKHIATAPLTFHFGEKHASTRTSLLLSTSPERTWLFRVHEARPNLFGVLSLNQELLRDPWEQNGRPDLLESSLDLKNSWVVADAHLENYTQSTETAHLDTSNQSRRNQLCPYKERDL